MSPVEVGTVFTTGNSTVSQLPEGTILTVVGPGKVQVGSVAVAAKAAPAVAAKVSFNVGDDIIVLNKNNRLGYIVRAGHNCGISVPENSVLYVSDATGEEVVRLAKKSNIKLA